MAPKRFIQRGTTKRGLAFQIDHGSWGTEDEMLDSLLETPQGRELYVRTLQEILTDKETREFTRKRALAELQAVLGPDDQPSAQETHSAPVVEECD
jgi:hypothetical protein